MGIAMLQSPPGQFDFQMVSGTPHWFFVSDRQVTPAPPSPLPLPVF